MRRIQNAVQQASLGSWPAATKRGLKRAPRLQKAAKFPILSRRLIRSHRVAQIFRRIEGSNSGLGESISNALFSENIPRLRWIVLDLTAEIGHVYTQLMHFVGMTGPPNFAK